MTANVKLCLSGPVDQLRIVWQTGEALLESVPFEEDPEGTRYNVLVALQEMVTNVLRHAYAGDESLPIEVEFQCSERGFCVEVRDRGAEFDPLAYEVGEASDADVMPKQAGGYGILIAQTCMDQVEYERRQGWNCVRLTKFADASVLVGND